MYKILKEQTLDKYNLFCYRGMVDNVELEQIGKDMEKRLQDLGRKRIGYPITATYGTNGSKADIELLLPIDGEVNNEAQYYYKKRLKIVNAVVAEYIGNPKELNAACNELNEYIVSNGLTPITAGYSIPKKVDVLDTDSTQVDVYVGISPNIL